MRRNFENALCVISAWSAGHTASEGCDCHQPRDTLCYTYIDAGTVLFISGNKSHIAAGRTDNRLYANERHFPARTSDPSGRSRHDRIEIVIGIRATTSDIGSRHTMLSAVRATHPPSNIPMNIAGFLQVGHTSVSSVRHITL